MSSKGEMNSRYAVIMAGGGGTRLWPLSTEDKPKQFQSILSERSLLEHMYLLLLNSFSPEKIFIQVPKKYTDLVLERLPQVDTSRILIEPEARDTAPAFVHAAVSVSAIDPGATLGFYYSDHLIQSESMFNKAVESSFDTAEKFPDHLVLVGVQPLYPHTGLGYIESGSEVAFPQDGVKAFKVKSFKEKPDIEKAKDYVVSGKHLWNTGYKVANVSYILQLLADSSDIFKQEIPNLLKASSDKNDTATMNSYQKLPKISFEYVVSEKAKNMLVLPSEMIWSDVGDWGVIDEALGGENNSSRVRTAGKVVEHESENTLIVSSHRPVVGVGLKDLIVIETEEGVLVMAKEKVGEMKRAINKLKDLDSNI